jgi:hypothetical protein
MKNKWTKTILISMLAVLVMGIGAIAVFAQNGDAGAEEAVPMVEAFHGHGRGGFPGGHGDGEDRQAELAEALGISIEELEAAQREVREARIAQMVEDGVITLDQANLMLAKDALNDYIDRNAIMAEVLGLTEEEFEAVREDGSLRDLLANITPAELQEKTQAAVEEALQQAVDDSVITTEQAELVRERMADGFGFGPHRGFGGHARPGGFSGRGGENSTPAEELQTNFAPSV